MRKYLFYIASLFCLLSCGSPKQKEDVIRTDINSLLENIQLPYRPLKVVWQVGPTNGHSGRAPGPNDFGLIAVASFSEADFAELSSQIEKLNDIKEKVYLQKDFVKDWFPESVKKEFYLEGEYHRVATRVYSAKLFAKSPYTDGLLFLTNRNEVFISMFTT